MRRVGRLDDSDRIPHLGDFFDQVAQHGVGVVTIQMVRKVVTILILHVCILVFSDTPSSQNPLLVHAPDQEAALCGEEEERGSTPHDKEAEEVLDGQNKRARVGAQVGAARGLQVAR